MNPNVSNILPPPNNTNRFGEFDELITSDQEGLQENHEAYKLSEQKYPELTKNEIVKDSKGIRYKLISDIGRPYY